MEVLVFRRNILSTQAGPKPKILSVSKDRLLVNIRQSILSRVGYTVTAAENASEALVKLASQSFDLMILCHTLPRREKRLLESESKAKHIPVLSVTQSNQAPHNKALVGSLDKAAGFLEKVKALTPPTAWIPRGPLRRYDA
jgi:CheY-like chemotaxis protein